MQQAPPWRRAEESASEHAALEDVDVAVVGGGITGMTAAVTAAEQGARVAVLEARHLAAGTTGSTTGKLTSQHGLCYAELVATHGRRTAEHYAGANHMAIDLVDGLVARYAIDCDLEPVSHVVHASGTEAGERIVDEHRAAAGLGLPAHLDREVEPPLLARAALRFDEQRHLEPVRYVLGLAEALTALGGRVHVATRVTGVLPGPRDVRVRTERGQLRAGQVIIATLLPPLDRALAFVRHEPVRAYGIAAAVADELPRASYLGVDEPTRSVRAARDDEGRPRLLVVGESHTVGREPAPGARLDRLRDYAERRWRLEAVTHQWSAQDYLPLDGLPTVGPIDHRGRCWVATGFGKWGLGQGTYAGWLIACRLADREVPFDRHLHPPRRLGRHELVDALRFNLDSGRRLVTDRLRRSPDPRTLAPGDGAVVREGARLVATHRRDDGSLGRVSARCTHLGCVVAWNAFERSWDCPCHGSRFGADGEVLEGPAVRPLPPQDRPGEPGGGRTTAGQAPPQ